MMIFSACAADSCPFIPVDARLIGAPAEEGAADSFTGFETYEARLGVLESNPMAQITYMQWNPGTGAPAHQKPLEAHPAMSFRWAWMYHAAPLLAEEKGLPLEEVLALPFVWIMHDLAPESDTYDSAVYQIAILLDTAPLHVAQYTVHSATGEILASQETVRYDISAE